MKPRDNASLFRNRVPKLRLRTQGVVQTDVDRPFQAARDVARVAAAMSRRARHHPRPHGSAARHTLVGVSRRSGRSAVRAVRVVLVR